jgi:hypothetical protein
MTKRTASNARANRLVVERLSALCVTASTFTEPAEAVAWLGALQAQDYLGALWAVGLRTVGATEVAVEAALANGSIVRTWPLRGTLHFVAANDARWLTELLAPRAIAAGANRLRGAGIDATVLRKARAVLEKRLHGKRCLSRPDVYRAFEDAGIRAAEQRGLYILWQLAHERFLCFGPRVGKQPSFVLFDEWVPNAPERHGEEALAELAVRYFGGHGPATLRDLAWWSGLTHARARTAILAAGKRLRRETVDDEEHFRSAMANTKGRARGSSHVLPAFDELLVGYAYGGTSVDAAVAKRVRSGGMIHPVVVCDGRVVATWTRRLTPREVRCHVNAFESIDRVAVSGVERAFERYARFLGRTLRLEVAAARERQAATARRKVTKR